MLHNAVATLFHVDERVFFLRAVIGAPMGVAVGLLRATATAVLGWWRAV